MFLCGYIAGIITGWIIAAVIGWSCQAAYRERVRQEERAAALERDWKK